MIPKKIYINDKAWSEAAVSVSNCDMQNREYIDLSQVWHDASEEPKPDYPIICELGEGEMTIYDCTAIPSGADWECMVDEWKITRWASISDLLPKGGAK